MKRSSPGRQQAAFARLMDLNLQLLGGVHQRVARRVWRDAQSADHAAAGAIERGNHPAKGMQVPGERPSDDQRRPGGTLERDGLGHQFADHDVQKREQREGQRQRQAVRQNRRAVARKPVEHGPEDLGECRFTQGAQAQAGERDANLHAGNDAIELGEQLLHHARARNALVDQLAHAGDAHGNQRKFRRRKETVNAHQRQHGQQSQTDHTIPILTACGRHPAVGKVKRASGVLPRPGGQARTTRKDTF